MAAIRVQLRHCFYLSFTGLTEALGEDTDTTMSALYAVASLAAAWSQLNHGMFAL